MHYLSEQDVVKVLRTTYAMNTKASRRDHLVMLVQIATGGRIEQASSVRGEDIFQKDGKWVIYIRPLKGGEGNTYSLRISEDPAFDMTPLIQMAATAGLSLLFGTLHTSNYNKNLKTYFRAAGIHTMYAHSHVFRHTVAMIIWNATQSLGAVQRFLGHVSSSSTLIYLKENNGIRAQEAMDNLILT